MPFEKLRMQYKPENVKVLFVGESVPAGERFFYLERGCLYQYTKEAFGEAFPDITFSLDIFNAMGCWLYDICPRPVYHLTPAEKAIEIENGAESLSDVIREFKPAYIVALKMELCGAVARANREAGEPVKAANIFALPFPTVLTGRIYASRLSAVLLHVYGIPACRALFEAFGERRFSDIEEMLDTSIVYGSTYQADGSNSRSGCFRIQGRQKVVDHLRNIRNELEAEDRPFEVDVRFGSGGKKPRLFASLGACRCRTYIVKHVEMSNGKISKLYIDRA